MKKITSFFDDPKLSEIYDKRSTDSIDYLKSRNWKAMSNEVPDEMLDWWTSEWSLGENGRMIYAEPVITNHAHFIVFGRAFMRDMMERLYIDHDFFDRMNDSDPDIMLRASKLVRYVRSARKEKREIPDFDMFDVERYDEIVKMLKK